MTDTIETNADTSLENETQNVENTEPADVDTSDTESEVSNNEPVNDEVNEENQTQEGKYKTLEQANKAYADLEKKLGEQSTELGELRKLAERVKEQEAKAKEEALQNAQDNGFNSVIEYENHNELVSFIADEYEKCLSECSYPDEVKNLLEQYRQTPDKEILKAIKSEFDLDTVERIALDTKVKERELQDRIYKEVEASANNYLNENVKKHADLFQNPAFTELYGEAFRAYGTNLDTDRFINLMNAFADFKIKSAGINNGVINDNKSATDEIAGLTSGGSAAQNNSSEKDILSMSDAEMKREILSKI